MSPAFTDYVRSLSPEGEPPDEESFAHFWEALRGAVCSEIKRRGLWSSPPSYLGVYGCSSWQGPQRAGPGGETDALDELVAECYVYVFVRRLRCLRRLATVNPSIDGVVFRSIRNFLHETQQAQDPLGYRVFRVLRAALQRLVDDGRLHVLAGGPKIGNETIFGFRAEAEPRPAAEDRLAEIVGPWNDALLPELITASGQEEAEVVGALAERVAGLAADGVEVFRFKELIDPFKADVRARWAALLERAEGETALDAGEGDLKTVVRLLQPDTGVEDRDAFRKLVAAVDDELDRLHARRRTRRHLATLWRFLRTYALEAGEDKPPSHRKLSQLLGIPRDRFPELYGTLRDVIARCDPSTCGPRRVSSSRGAVCSSVESK